MGLSVTRESKRGGRGAGRGNGGGGRSCAAVSALQLQDRRGEINKAFRSINRESQKL